MTMRVYVPIRESFVLMQMEILISKTCSGGFRGSYRPQRDTESEYYWTTLTSKSNRREQSCYARSCLRKKGECGINMRAFGQCLQLLSILQHKWHINKMYTALHSTRYRISYFLDKVWVLSGARPGAARHFSDISQYNTMTYAQLFVSVSS